MSATQWTMVLALLLIASLFLNYVLIRSWWRQFLQIRKLVLAQQSRQIR